MFFLLEVSFVEESFNIEARKMSLLEVGWGGGGEGGGV